MNNIKSIFLGDYNILSSWIDRFPDLKSHIMDFIDINVPHYSALLERVVRDNGLQIQLVLSVGDNCYESLKKEFKVFQTISIRQYIINSLIESELIPSKLRIDASTLCQLNCADCYMRIDNNGTMGIGYLTYKHFKQIVDDNPYINEIELSNSGEIFLNPDLNSIIKYAHYAGVKLMAYNGCNFNTVSNEIIESMVKYKFYGITVSIDGGSPSVYSKYRVNGDFYRVIANIRKLITYKQKYGSLFPHIKWQYIIMEHNELDIPNAKRIANILDIPIEFKLTWDDNYHPHNIEFLKKETGLEVFTRNDYKNKYGHTYLGHLQCKQMFLSPQINWDGRLLGCCGLYTEDFGVNVFNVGLRTALKSSTFVNSKKALLSCDFSSLYGAYSPCLNCKKRNQIITDLEKFDPFKNIKI